MTHYPESPERLDVGDLPVSRVALGVLGLLAVLAASTLAYAYLSGLWQGCAILALYILAAGVWYVGAFVASRRTAGRLKAELGDEDKQRLQRLQDGYRREMGADVEVIVLPIADAERTVQAACMPWTKRPTILLTDRLVRELSEDELRAVVAHELAHHERHDGPRFAAGEAIVGALGAAGVAWGLTAIIGAPVRWPLAWGVLLALLSLLAWGLSRDVVFRPLLNLWSRRQEYRADRRAVEIVGDAELIASAYKKAHMLAGEKAGKGWLGKVWVADAPTLEKRLARLERARVHRSNNGSAQRPATMESLPPREHV